MNGRRLAVLGAVLAVGIAGLPAGGALSQERAAFDFDTGNAITEVIFPVSTPGIRTYVSQSASDASLVVRIVALMDNGWFDAIAPYHPTAVGIYSRLGRRPAGEGATNRNKNIAILYSTYRVLSGLVPQGVAEWRRMLASVGLDPDDRGTDARTPVGLGNLAAQAVLDRRARDGMNQLGDEGGRRYHRRPYADYTGYRPVNTADELRDPSRWQPAVTTTGAGIFRAQQFVTPQWAVTRPYSFTDPARFRVPPPKDSDHRNRQGYKRQADEVIAASAALTDEQKMKAELFNDKFLALGFPAVMAAENRRLPLDRFVHSLAATELAAFDAGIAIWSEKRRYDAVRPFSAIAHVYGRRPITAWGGPGKGTVTDLPAHEWKSYLNVADHPEYPSGSAGFCSALAQVQRRVHGTDQVDLSLPREKGSSLVEPGLTPARDITLRWSSWTALEDDCGLSRVWGGVHFKAASRAGHEIGRAVGEAAYAFVREHVSGQAPPPRS
ncbi:vanadium-dependent haloperoxidase [Nonomuraea sp. NPDC055795]